MAQKSAGSRNKTRKKLSKRSRDKDSINSHLKTFDEGEQVTIDIDSAIHKGLPHPQFHGQTGTVTGQRGRSYLVTIADGNKSKELTVHPAHLKEA